MASVLADYDWDWKGAEREFNATVALDPNYAVAYQYYGYALLGMGRGEEALAAMKRAAVFDPVSPSIQASLGWAHFLMHQEPQAIEVCKRDLEMYPDFVPAHLLLTVLYSRMHADQRAANEIAQAGTIAPSSTITPMVAAYQVASAGDPAGAARLLEASLARARAAGTPDFYNLAAAWTAIGDKQKAFDSLDRAYEARSNWFIYLRYDPRFDALHGDPHFTQLVSRIGNIRN